MAAEKYEISDINLGDYQLCTVLKGVVLSFTLIYSLLSLSLSDARLRARTSLIFKITP